MSGDQYTNWRARLAGKEVKTFLQPQLDDAGYYRLPITNRKPNGQTDVTGWVPVAMWVDGEEMTGLVGAGDEMREMTSTQLCGEQFWSWICRHPITYEVYDAVANNGAPWPDSPAEQLANTMGDKPPIHGSIANRDARLAVDQQGEIPAANREVTRNDNRPEEPELPPHEAAAQAIDKAIAVSKAHVVSDLKSAEIGLGISNRLAELRLQAKRDGEAAYKPVYAEYTKLRGMWVPPVERAEAEEKSLNVRINSWKRAEEKRLRDEAAKAEADRVAAAAKAEEERKQREAKELERTERAADRAIAEGIPPAEQELAFEVEMPEPEPEKPAPAPAAAPVINLNGTYGKRKLRETKPEPVITITDFDAVYAFFKNTESVRACLTILVKGAVKVNVTVPGVTVTQPED